MSAAKVIQALLLAHSPVTNIVGDKVCFGTVSANKLPAIGLKEISRTEQSTVAMDGPTELVFARVQVTVHATSYREQKALLLAAKLGAGAHTGEVAGVKVRSVIRAGVGPDFSDDDAKIFQQSRDFMVTYLEPN